MAISPKDAARINDERIATAVAIEEAAIDDILAKRYYTGGPPVELEAPTAEEAIKIRLMQNYTAVGWRIEVRPGGQMDTPIWKFTRL